MIESKSTEFAKAEKMQLFIHSMKSNWWTKIECNLDKVILNFNKEAI